MAEEKTLHPYHGKEIDVTWDAKRCHMRPSACADSARCLTGGADHGVLPGVAPPIKLLRQ